MRPSTTFISALSLVLLCACEQRPAMVYVLDAPQKVLLTTSASTKKVEQGGTVTLHVERNTTGTWKQIPRDQLKRDQCWLYQPPPQHEPAVADNVHWVALPDDTVRFNTEYRMDHTRIATMLVKGWVTLTPLSTVRCEKERVIEGPAIQIEVL